MKQRRYTAEQAQELGCFGHERSCKWFDDQSWIDREGVKHPIEEKHLFHFWEGDFEPLDETRPSQRRATQERPGP